MSVRVSVIIPCYNQGHFIREALASVAACDQTLIEVIIVNDGSTDPDTNKIMRELAEQGMHIIFQENKGLAAARNAGISASKGEFILPLDADNKIYPAYIEKGLAAMDADASIGVVYGNANYFGAKSGDWKPGVFNLQRLMIANFIDACAVIRKST
ncbi:MAG: glycosyltransferase family 2 protein, partial [Moraxellaceae bacterium]